jgi:hypothetical protein
MSSIIPFTECLFFHLGEYASLITIGPQSIVSASFAALTPLQQGICYFVPSLASHLVDCTEINENDSSKDNIIPVEQKQIVLKELKDLTKLAKLPRKINYFTKTDCSFSGFGGFLSATKPVLLMPYEHLFYAPFSEGSAKSPLSLSKNETSFFICRELGKIKRNITLAKFAAAITMIALTAILFLSSISFLITLPAITAIFISYTFVVNKIHYSLDKYAIKLLTEHLGSEETALKVAISGLSKMKEVNLNKRKTSKWSKIAITSKGEERFSPKHSNINARLKKLTLLAKKKNLIID